ncbi:MAG TPA: SAM-dependent methyltransferase [Burkholderiaceae bacterium]|nr:SAM-dependent methyltransferase [Burkholderiaceae bacterium]
MLPLDDPTAAFVARFEHALADGALARLVLSRPRVAGADLQRVSARPVRLKGEDRVSFVHTHAARDVTKNLAPDEAVAALRALLDAEFSDAHLFTATGETRWRRSRKGKTTLIDAKHAPSASLGAAPAPHDREKQRFVALDRPFLAALGVADAQQRLVPAMARKFRQINKFVEVLDHALASSSTLRETARLDVVDFGSGKGYLTFATHDHLRHTLGRQARVTGVELRPDMVALCNAAVARLGLEGLHFEEGDVSTVVPPRIDVMIALHACDTATDHAIASGVRAGAALIVCAPCCHKELRPQLLQPAPLRPMLRHGVHLGQQAEMLTDALRAMLLDACGYDTQVFEFVALEHTQKNKMILAVKRAAAAGTGADAAWREIDDLKAFYGVRDQCLETLLRRRRDAAAV